jgi:hypothetical protein
MANVKISDVRKALPLAKQLVKKLDVDKEKGVSFDEVKRIKNRDNFVARNLVRTAMDRLTWPDNPGPYDVKSVHGELERALDSLSRADKNKDGVVSTTELKSASKVAKAFVEFAEVYKGKTASVFDIKGYEKPGTKEWVKLVEKDYFGRPEEPMNKPYFGTALVLKRSELPNAKLKAAFDAMVAANPGKTVQATSSRVNEATVYYLHAFTDSRYDAQLFDDKGKKLATGVITPNPRDARADWISRWT